jgi:site-specific recombinase XerD
MAGDSEYQRQLKEQRKRKLRDIKSTIPGYCASYLDDRELSLQINSVIAYARDLRTFFEFLHEKNPTAAKCETLREIPLDLLEQLTFEDINEYQRYLSYSDGENPHMNEEKGIARRMAALRSFFEYQTTHHYMKNNPTIGAAKRRKQPQKDIIRLDREEVHEFLDVVESGDGGTKKMIEFHEKTKYRDVAILTLLLNTGIRVSECVGLDLEDVNFRDDTIRVVRKGGNTATLYFGEDVHMALLDYIELERPQYADEEEKALFLSLKRGRMAVRSIQQMVKKYARIAVPDKKISPHKMRSTYGTALYQQSGDIRLVADVLGHKDINTTAKHYAAIEEEHRRQAAKFNPYG